MLKEPPLVTNLQAGMEKTELGTKLLVFEQTQKMSRSKEIYPLPAAEKTKFSGRIESEPKPPKLFGSIRRRKRVTTILEMFELVVVESFGRRNSSFQSSFVSILWSKTHSSKENFMIDAKKSN